MDDFPVELLTALPRDSESIARTWWASLSDADRHRLVGLWDERLEIRFFTPQATEDGQPDTWEQVPRVIGGRFVPTDDARGINEWGPSYFEHLLQHPELVIVWEPIRRTFYIGCMQHVAARACLSSGFVPVGFVCPVRLTNCPLMQLRGAHLGGNRGVKDAEEDSRVENNVEEGWGSFQAAKGSHTVWTHPKLPEGSLTLAGNDGDDAKRYQEKQVRDAIDELENEQ